MIRWNLISRKIELILTNCLISTRLSILFAVVLFMSHTETWAQDSGSSKPILCQKILMPNLSHNVSTQQQQMLDPLSALDAFGTPTAAVSLETGDINWQTPMAYKIMQKHFADQKAQPHQVPQKIVQWLQQQFQLLRDNQPTYPMTLKTTDGELVINLKPYNATAVLITFQEISKKNIIKKLIEAFKLTPSEAEVLYWTVKGKTDPEIGDIVGSSAGTAKKHSENIRKKMLAQTRTEASKMAIQVVPELAIR